ncbi:MAG: hypothetical protein FWE07_02315 [Turicibacter sp.]|nr:hypothetical protein [Turicibacter sp.]
MKKLIMMMASFATVVALTACGGGLDAFELLELSNEAQADADISSIFMEIEMEVFAQEDGDVFEDINMFMRFEVEDEERMGIEISMVDASFNDEFNMQMYLRDGYIYMRDYDNGHVFYDREDVGGMNSFDMMDELIDDGDFFTVNEDWVAESSAEETDNGYRLEFVYNFEGVSAYLEDADFPGLDEVSHLFDDEDGDSEWSLIMVMYIDADYLLISAEMVMEISIADGDEIGELMMSATMEVRDVTITFPDWLDEIGTFDGPPVAEADLIGTWEWDLGGYVYIFNEDGTGQSGFVDDLWDWEWEINDDNILYLDSGFWVERHGILLDGDTLTLVDLETMIEFTYLRNDDLDLDANDDADDDDDDNDVSSNASSADADDWRAFLAEYEDIVMRLNANPLNMSIFEEYIDWLERSEDVINALALEDMLEFTEEMLRITELLDF